jgi:hypothetical protein
MIPAADWVGEPRQQFGIGRLHEVRIEGGKNAVDRL